MIKAANPTAEQAQAAAQIRKLCRRARRRSVEAVKDYIAAGKICVQRKAKVPHGEWLKWVQLKCKLHPRTAQNYMLLARHEQEALAINANSDSPLSVTEILALLAKRKSRSTGRSQGHDDKQDIDLTTPPPQRRRTTVNANGSAAVDEAGLVPLPDDDDDECELPDPEEDDERRDDEHDGDGDDEDDEDDEDVDFQSLDARKALEAEHRQRCEQFEHIRGFKDNPFPPGTQAAYLFDEAVLQTRQALKAEALTQAKRFAAVVLRKQGLDPVLLAMLIADSAKDDLRPEVLFNPAYSQ